MATSQSPDTSQSVYGLGITPGMGYITGPEGQRAEAEALRTDRSRARRVVVSLVGRERQGKTSLRRLLAGEPFNADEPSTVGLERDMVDTQALDPGSDPGRDWRSVQVDTVNRKEYQEVLGRKIHLRLEDKRQRIPVTQLVLNDLRTMTTIGAITYVSVFFFFFASSLAVLRGWPIWGITMVIMFTICGATFGRKDGFGIAVGVYHLMILCESFLRWKLEEAFVERVSTYGILYGHLWGVVWYGAIECVAATCFGMSLGLGMACTFCLSRPESFDYFQGGSPLMGAEPHLMMVSALIGLGLVKYKYGRLLIPVVVIFVLVLLPSPSAFVFVCGSVSGTFHGLLLALGQSFFLKFNNCVIKRVTTHQLGRHMVRHCFGLIPGFLLTRYIFGWTLVTSPLQSVCAHFLSAALLVAVNEINIFDQIWPFLSALMSSAMISKTSSLSPFATISNRITSHRTSEPPTSMDRRRTSSLSLATEQPTAVLASPTSALPPSPRLVIRDFAGHPLYYSAHHVYMAAQCVYVLVFSLVEARQRFHDVLRNLIDWLQSIYLHAGFPDTRVFLVGTHRDDPSLRDGQEEDFVGTVGLRLRRGIPRSYHNILVWTDKDVPFFPVENSIRNHKDEDHRNLRQQLLSMASEINSDEFPVRYFYFFHVLDDLRSEGRLLANTDHLRQQCEANNCAIEDEKDMDAMLLLFRRLGEVLYFPEDNLLQSVVVLSPHGVLSVLSRLIDIPMRADRARHFMTQWDMLATRGVCSRALFEHVLDVHASELLAQSDTIVYLLQTLNLMCPLSMGGGNFESGGGGGGGGDGGGSGNGGGNFNLGGLRYRKGSGSGGGRGGRGGRGAGGGGDDDGDHNGDNHDDNDDDDESDEDNTGYSQTLREQPVQESSHTGELLLVPAALPVDLPHGQALWDTSPQDWELLIDGLPLLPHPAFLRLLSACAAQDACHSLDDLGLPVLTACQARAAFTMGRSRCYKLEWMGTSEVADTYHGRLMKVVVAGWKGDDEGRYRPGESVTLRGGSDASIDVAGDISSDVSPQSVVEFVWRTLSEIVRRDFGRCHLRLGVACPCLDPHQVSCEEMGFHFLSLTDTRDGSTSWRVPRTKEFWCQGRRVVYSGGQVCESTAQRVSRLSVTVQSVRGPALLNTPLRSIPQSLHASICDLLDVPHVLGNDWTALAGHLCKTARDVDLLKFRAPRDPCDALLQDWASRQPDVTLRDLLCVMQVMERLDVVKTIEDFVL